VRTRSVVAFRKLCRCVGVASGIQPLCASRPAFVLRRSVCVASIPRAVIALAMEQLRRAAEAKSTRIWRLASLAEGRSSELRSAEPTWRLLSDVVGRVFYSQSSRESNRAGPGREGRCRCWMAAATAVRAGAFSVRQACQKRLHVTRFCVAEQSAGCACQLCSAQV
jgi:hypothetical protein